MGLAFTPPSRDFLRELQVLRREVDALKRMPSGAGSISAEYLAAVPACRVYRSASQNLPASTRTAISYDSEYQDTWGMHDTAANSWRLTAPIPGWYEVGATAGVGANTSGSIRELFFQKNLDATWTDFRWAESSALPASVPARFTVSTVLRLAAGDWMSVVIYQNATVDLATQNDAQLRDEAWMCWLGN